LRGDSLCGALNWGFGRCGHVVACCYLLCDYEHTDLTKDRHFLFSERMPHDDKTENIKTAKEI